MSHISSPLTRTFAGFCLVTLSQMAQAKSYLSFDLGEDSRQQVIAQLSTANADFDPGYGYKGYAEDLPSIKVENYQGFSKFGEVTSAWLSFAPDKSLYKISVTYADSGRLHKIFGDSLNQKYGSASFSGRGFVKTQRYSHGDVAITLTRNEFGFGNDQKTSLEYEFTPNTAAVEDMRVRIDEHIANQNAEKAGDL